MLNVCLSGGAIGADLQFGMCAGTLGHSVIHFSFEKHRTGAPIEEVVKLSQDQLNLADPFLIEANKTVKRRFNPGNLPIANLLRRNWYQVKDSESVYAVSSFKDGEVDGGTAWAVAMFLDRHKAQPCPCYVYDQKTDVWMAWEGRWQAIDAPPSPSSVYAGIGSRALLENGKNAIRTLMNYGKNIS